MNGVVMDTNVADEAFDINDFYGTAALRWYQIAARNAVAQEIAKGTKRVLIKMPTGTGKTLTIACTLNHPDTRTALNIPKGRPLRVLFIAHKHRLLTQAERAFVEGSGVTIVSQENLKQSSMYKPTQE